MKEIKRRREEEKKQENGAEQESEQEKKEAEGKGKEGVDQERDDSEQNEDKSSDTESDIPLITHKSGHEYSLRRRGLTKFLNTVETALDLSPSPFLSPSTPVHISLPKAIPSHTSRPPFPH